MTLVEAQMRHGQRAAHTLAAGTPPTPLTPSETAPLLYSFSASTSPTSLNRLYGSSRPVSPRSAPVPKFWPEIPTKSRAGKWTRWIGGAGILAEFEWPFDHDWPRLGKGDIDRSESSSPKTASSSRRRRWKEVIPSDALVVPLFLITFSCAMADAATLVGYQTFATSMTGNTVLLAISVFGLSHKPPIYAAASLLTFLGAGLVFGQIGGVIGHKRRSWLLSSMTFQILLLLLAAWTVSPLGWKKLRLGGRMDWAYLLLIGLQGGPQVTLATNAGIRELPTAMMTTPYAAFISDPSLFSLPSSDSHSASVIPRNRRAIYIILFWAGAFAGGALLKWSSIWVLTVVVAAIKVLAAGMIWVSRGSRPDDDGSESDSEDGVEVEEEAIADTPLENSMFSLDGHKTRKRTSSVFESLSRQKPRDEQTVAM